MKYASCFLCILVGVRWRGLAVLASESFISLLDCGSTLPGNILPNWDVAGPAPSLSSESKLLLFFFFFAIFSFLIMCILQDITASYHLGRIPCLIRVVEGPVCVLMPSYLTSTIIISCQPCLLPLFYFSPGCFSVIIHSWVVSSSHPTCSPVSRSTTSSDAASLHEAPSSSLSNSTPSLASPSPSPSPSPAFLRPRPAGPQSRTKRISQLFLRGRSNSDRDRAVGEKEREIWASSAASSSHHYLPVASSSAPGLIKIYGDAFASGANYRSLLANIHSTSRQLIAQVITRYTEREREETEDAGMASLSWISAELLFFLAKLQSPIIWYTMLCDSTYLFVVVKCYHFITANLKYIILKVLSERPKVSHI